MTPPHATHAGRRDREPPPFQRLRDTDLAPARCSIAISTTAFSTSRSEEHTSELQSPCNLVCRLLLEKKTQHSTHSSAYQTRLGPHSNTRPRERVIAPTTYPALFVMSH